MQRRDSRLMVLSMVVTAGLLSATPGAADELAWSEIYSENFGNFLSYPAGLFTTRRSPGAGTALFAENDDATLMVWNVLLKQDEKPYDFVCPVDCPARTYTLKKEYVAAASGYIGKMIYYSKCVKAWKFSIKEMHCFHFIYPTEKRTVYDSVVVRMSNSLK